MRVTVIAPERALFEGDADSVIVPAFDGQVGILPKHAPFMTLLGGGRLTVRHGSTSQAFRIRGGLLQVVRDNVRIVAEEAQIEE